MSNAPESHWCNHCEKHVTVRTLDDLVMCCECNKGFVRSIQATPATYSSPEPPPPSSEGSIRFEELLEEYLRRRQRDIERLLARYEALLREREYGGGVARRGAPPAAKSAIEALETFEVGSTSCEEGERMSLVCAVCKDAMVVGEIGKKLPCGHYYHRNCILPWLETRNSCPVCRFQLRTDDVEYERKRAREAPPLNVSMRGREEPNEHHVVETLRRSTRKRKPNRRFMD